MSKLQANGCPVSRVEFFNNYWAALADHGWKSLILHTWQEFPDTVRSDIDYAVAGPDAGELLRFLAEYCREQGWLLVQVIEHEPGAYFCVCVRTEAPFEFFQLDVTWGYRRIGHILVSSELLMEGRRRIEGKSFHVPTPGAECVYLLAKAAAKGKGFDEIRQRLGELLSEDEEGCRQVVEKAFDVWFPRGCGDESHLSAVAEWYPRVPAIRAVRSGRRFGIAEIVLYLRRTFHPTGFKLILDGGAEMNEKVEAIAGRLAPLYRGVHHCSSLTLRELPGVILQLIRTNLVIEEGGSKWTRGGFTVDLSKEDVFLDILEHLAAKADGRIKRI